MFTKAVTLPRPRIIVDPSVHLSPATAAQYSIAKQRLMISSSLNETTQFASIHGNIEELLLL